MPRELRKPLELRKELLKCARDLFYLHGYDNTTVNDIIQKAKVSKGAFYHYFDSKESLLEALGEQAAVEVIAELEDVITRPGRNAIDQLNAFWSNSRKLKVDSAVQFHAAFDAIFSPENEVLLHRVSRAVTDAVAGPLSQIIKNGVEQGLFSTPDPEGTARMLLELGGSVHSAIAEVVLATTPTARRDNVQLLERRIALYGLAFDRILGLPDGTIEMAEPGFAEAVMPRGRSRKSRKTS